MVLLSYLIMLSVFSSDLEMTKGMSLLYVFNLAFSSSKLVNKERHITMKGVEP